ncbi:TnsD family Tn7-like transposition protein [Sutcliffiella cohnii]|uniref:TnsD family Tn7-like transposition protein n=1 Tax=Sutcliffiella cohnii TaxID=33932 RepID=UPI0009FD9320|nr:TnsD family Tn7-like transposition protein [Sutcliffiella cohnii]
MERILILKRSYIGVSVLISFPFLYKDELMYSILARYHMYSGNENAKITMSETFGSSTLCAATTLPANLDQLTKRLPTPNSYSTEELINNHTFLPYFAPFIPNERYQEIKLMMSESDGKSIYMKLGKTASTVKSPEYLRYCQGCVKEERVLYGECYWHRLHQVEGVVVCPKHGYYLIESDVPFSDRKNKHEFAPLEKYARIDEALNRKDDFPHFVQKKFIGEQTFYLLNNIIKPLGLEELQKFYITKLKQKGLATVSGRVKWIELIPLFNHYYSAGFLKELNCCVTEEDKDTWLHKVLRKPKISCHPLRHILLLGFLGETILSLEQKINTNFEPFGNGPWPCLNKASNHYKKHVIKSCVITSDSKLKVPVGTFSCDCGFIYSRRGPDQKEDDIYKIGRIKEFGPVWNRRLSELSKLDLSLRKRAEILGVDPITVKNKLNHQYHSEQTDQTDSMLEEYRKEWIQLIAENKKKSITEIRFLKPGVYMWLYRNDREFLKNNFPKGRKNKKSSKRIDWEKRDSEIAEQIELITKEIMNDTNLIRVTKNEIGRRIKGFSMTGLYKYFNRMPKTTKALDKHIETVEQFQIRRLKFIASELRESNPSIKEWKLIRKVGLRKEYVEKHRKIIEQEMFLKVL